MQISVATPDLDAAVKVTSKGFVQPVTPSLTQDVKDHLVGDITLILEDPDTGNLGGYAVFLVRGQLLYLHGMMLDPNLQGGHHARALIQTAKERSGATHLGLRTQSSIMWAAGKAVCTSWVPELNATSPDANGLTPMLDLATKVAGSPRARHAGCYNGQLYGEKPIHTNAEVQRWWDSMCNFERGDAIICVGLLRK